MTISLKCCCSHIHISMLRILIQHTRNKPMSAGKIRCSLSMVRYSLSVQPEQQQEQALECFSHYTYTNTHTRSTDKFRPTEFAAISSLWGLLAFRSNFNRVRNLKNKPKNRLNMSGILPATYVKGFHDEEQVKRMEYRSLGKTGLQVSKISFGGGALCANYGYARERMQKESESDA